MTEQNRNMFVIDGSASVEPSNFFSESPGDIGTTLAQARAAMGRSVDQMARDLRIRYDFLEALEENRFADLPALPYAAGFLRSYARALGLDPDPLIDQFKREMGDPHDGPELEFPAPPRERHVPAFALILMSLILIALAYGGWRMVGSNEVIEIAQPDRPAIQAGNGRANPASPVPGARGEQATGTSSAAGAASPGAAVGTATQRAAPGPHPGDDVAAAAPRVGGHTASGPHPDGQTAAAAGTAGTAVAASEDNVEEATSGAMDGEAAASTDGAATVAESQGIVLRATSNSWLRIRDANGRTVVAHLLRSGESFQVPDQEGLTMTLGNPGGVRVIVDGRRLEPLGASGVPVHGVSLDRDSLRQRP